MRKCLALLALFLAPAAYTQAQEVVQGSTNTTPEVQKPSRDFVMIQFTYDGWMKPDSIRTTGFGRGFNAYLCYDFPIGKSNFSFAAGLGIGTSNIFLDNQELSLTDTGSLAGAARFLPESRDYSKYKLTTAYLEAPFELRFFGNKVNRNKGFKAAIGLRVGSLLSGHTKGSFRVEGSKFREKENTKRYFEPWRFAGTARIGWGNITLFGSYNLNTVFKPDVGPPITPYSLGICITGL